MLMKTIQAAAKAVRDGREAFARGETYESVVMEGRPVHPPTSDMDEDISHEVFNDKPDDPRFVKEYQDSLRSARLFEQVGQDAPQPTWDTATARG